METSKHTEGFTLIEVLMVIGIISILAAIVLVALNPARQFAQGRNAQRLSNVNSLLNSVGQYIAENLGELPSGIPSGDPNNDGDWKAIDNSFSTFCNDIVPNYMAALPIDPDPDIGVGGPDVEDCSVEFNTGYEIIQNENTGRISVRAIGTEIPPAEKIIKVTR